MQRQRGSQRQTRLNPLLLFCRCEFNFAQCFAAQKASYEQLARGMQAQIQDMQTCATAYLVAWCLSVVCGRVRVLGCDDACSVLTR
jgi:hypothetical protein